MTNSTKMKREEKPTLLLKAVYEGAAMRQDLENMRRAQQTFEACGLDVEAKRMKQKINEQVMEIKRKVDEAIEQRQLLIREMLVAFSAGDIATACADKMEAVFKRLAFGRDGDGGKALAEVFRLQARGWNRVVQMVDGNGGSDRVSMLYADMAEEVVKAVLPVIYGIVDRVMASKEGQIL